MHPCAWLPLSHTHKHNLLLFRFVKSGGLQGIVNQTKTCPGHRGGDQNCRKLPIFLTIFVAEKEVEDLFPFVIGHEQPLHKLRRSQVPGGSPVSSFTHGDVVSPS